MDIDLEIKRLEEIEQKLHNKWKTISKYHKKYNYPERLVDKVYNQHIEDAEIYCNLIKKQHERIAKLIGYL